MPSSKKNYSGAKNSNATVTPDCESVKIFSFDHDTSVEVVLINGEPWFVAADVCRALGLINPTDHIVKSLDEDEHLTYKIYRSGQQRTVNLISESGLYALAVRSTKPDARKFRKWITSEVLPSIRKTGMYITETAEKLSGQYVCVIGADGNLYLFSILKAMREFILEETKGYTSSELRLTEKIKAARILFQEDRDGLRGNKVRICSDDLLSKQKAETV
jgi:prophage antirepressor-like protein